MPQRIDWGMSITYVSAVSTECSKYLIWWCVNERRSWQTLTLFIIFKKDVELHNWTMQPVPLIQCISTYIWLTEGALRENTECSDPHHISSRSICLPVQTKAIICFIFFNWRSQFQFMLNGHVSIPSHSPYIPYPTAFPYGNGMVLHFYQQQESSTTKTVHKVINKGLKAYV